MESKLVCFFTLYAFIFSGTVRCSDTPCAIELSIDITDSVYNETERTYEKDNVVYDSANYFIEDGVTRGCICNLRNCVRKCCGYDEVLDGRSKNCTYDANLPDFLMKLPVEISTKPSYYVIHKMLQCGKQQRAVAHPENNTRDSFSVKVNGDIVHKNLVFKQESYCLDYISGTSLSAVFCISGIRVEAPVYNAGMMKT